MNKESVYSPHKVIKHLDKIKQLKKGKLILPTNVQIDLTNKCNMKCSFCFYDLFPLGDFDRKQEIPTDIMIRTLKELKSLGIPSIEWTGGGSVECHKDYKKIIAYANKLGFEQALVTNGTLLDDEALNLIKDFSWVRFSFDAITDETYSKVKGVNPKLGKRATINAEKLLGIKSDNCVVGASFIVCRDNHKEAFPFALWAKQTGFDNVRFSLAYTPEKEKHFEGIWEEVVSQINKAKRLNDKDFKVFSFSNRINDLSMQNYSPCCYYTQFVAVISPSGVYPCCTMKDDTKYNFGKIDKDTTFKDIWFSEKRKKFVEYLRTNVCRVSCWMTDKNKFIDYLMSSDAGHINFV